jgi:hypothetical protein
MVPQFLRISCNGSTLIEKKQPITPHFTATKTQLKFKLQRLAAPNFILFLWAMEAHRPHKSLKWAHLFSSLNSSQLISSYY